MWPSWLKLLLLFLPVVTAARTGLFSSNITLLTIVTALLLAADLSVLSGRRQPKEQTERNDTVERKRKYVHEIFRELGPSYQKRAYRMNNSSF